MSHPSSLHSVALFFRQLILTPREIGAFAPSSKRLGDAMAHWLEGGEHGAVLELGPGTGVITHSLMQAGLASERLIGIEQSREMTSLLRSRFPRSQFIEGDALRVTDTLRRHYKQIPRFSRVFSGLPLLNFPPRVRAELFRQLRDLLEPGGKVIQFSYRLNRGPDYESFQQCGHKFVWLNFPPARVSVYESSPKKSPHQRPDTGRVSRLR